MERTYIVVSDKSSKVLLSTTNYQEARKLMNRIASAGGSATLFRSMKP